ncbi:MAG: hypothetical protein HOV94_39590 [Saccharothrix sp.]|nr:hypothetical protein [Saccharothrix sp.]
MNQRIAAALIGTTMGLATFAGSTIAVSAAGSDAAPRQEQDPSKLVCKALEDLDLLDDPALADLVEKLGCKKQSPTSTTTSTSTSARAEDGRR